MSEFTRLDIIKELKDKHQLYKSVDFDVLDEDSLYGLLESTMFIVEKLLKNERK